MSEVSAALSRAYLWVLLAVMTVIVGWHDLLVPEKATADARTIELIASGHLTVQDDPSYGTVATVYRTLGLGDQPFLAGVLGGLAYSLIIVRVLTHRELRRLSPMMLVLLGGASVVGGIFLGQFSKDVFLVPIVLIALSTVRTPVAEVALIAAIVGYAAAFRSYWFLVLALYLVFRVAMRWLRHPAYLIAGTVIALLAITVVLPLITGDSVDSFREAANADRAGAADARSIITPPFGAGAGGIVGALSTAAIYLQLLLPVQLMGMGAQYVIYGLCIFAMWAAFLIAVARGMRGRTQPPVWYRAVALVLAFVAVQAVFEPDYGSYLRHLAVFIPVIAFVIAAVPAGGGSHAPQTQRTGENAHDTSAARS